MNIAVISGNYPSYNSPTKCVFVHQFALTMQQIGARVTVIAPEPVRLRSINKVYTQHIGYDEYMGIKVLRPAILSLSNIRVPWFGSTFPITVNNFVKGILLAVHNENASYDCCYGHFLFPAGAGAIALAQAFGIPSIVSLGESSLSYYEAHFRPKTIRKYVSKISGLLSVSDINRKYAVERFKYPYEKTLMLSNAVDTDRFCPKDKIACRNELKLPLDRPIIVFVGHFNERKGPLRVLKAINQWPEIGAIFIGRGPQFPKGKQVLFAGPVAHEDLACWLNAADVFVLPTLGEGSPNAVWEAMACGLAVVTSDLPFCHEFLNGSSACLIDPLNVDAIGKSIRLLLDNSSLRKQLGVNAIKLARQSSLANRTAKINSWINEIIVPSFSG